MEIGLRMTVTFMALYAMELGAGVLLSGLIVMSKSLGAMIFNIPAGFLIGKRKTLPLLLAALSGLFAAAMMRGLVSTPLYLLAAGFFTGISATLWDLTRLTYIRNNVPIELRGRVLSGMGGLFRLSRIIGPLAGGLLIESLGYRSMFYFQAVLIGGAFFLILLLLPRGRGIISSTEKPPSGYLKEHLSENRRNITAATVGIMGISILRAGRDFILPLWAAHIGIGIPVLGAATSLSALIELSLFYPAGWIMDNLGRKWTLFPASVIMACGFMLLPLTGGIIAFFAVMTFINMGNGIASGINMTLGTDLAPPGAPGQFLGLWRFFSDGAMALGPVIAGLVSKELSLGMSPLFIGGVGFLTASFVLRFMSRMKYF